MPDDVRGRSAVPALTGVRIVAATSVLAYHYSLAQPNATGPIHNIASLGFLGVNFFFVLSGFILLYNYYKKDTSAGEFYVARFARVYPTFIAAMLLTLVARHYLSSIQAEPHLAPHNLIFEALVIHGWFFGAACTANCPDWSISVEAFAYALFPFVLVLISKHSPARGWAAAFAIWLCSLIPAFFVYAAETRYGGAAVNSIFQYVVYHPLLHFGEFLLGAMAGKAFLSHLEHPHEMNMRYSTLSVVAVMVLLLAWFAHHPPNSETLLRAGLISPLFVACILYIAIAKDSYIARLLSLGPVVLLGEASYSIYLYQSFVGTLMKPLQGYILPWLMGPLTLAILVAFSILSYLALEKPARAALNTLWRKSTPVPASLAPSRIRTAALAGSTKSTGPLPNGQCK